jgi:hypothetical protein
MHSNKPPLYSITSSACEQRDGHFDAERLRGLEFDHELDAPSRLVALRSGS